MHHCLEHRFVLLERRIGAYRLEGISAMTTTVFNSIMFAVWIALAISYLVSQQPTAWWASAVMCLGLAVFHLRDAVESWVRESL